MNLTQVLKELLKGEAQLFDVREAGEWKEKRLKHSSLVPLSKLEKGVAAGGDREKKTYLHCRSGRRVLIAEVLLRKQGFREPIPLTASFETLQEAGL